jgi:hypothetical protein
VSSASNQQRCEVTTSTATDPQATRVHPSARCRDSHRVLAAGRALSPNVRGKGDLSRPASWRFVKLKKHRQAAPWYRIQVRALQLARAMNRLALAEAYAERARQAERLGDYRRAATLFAQAVTLVSLPFDDQCEHFRSSTNVAQPPKPPAKGDA